jgi:hypothetical protein
MTIGSRVVALALFASAVPYGIFILTILHLIAMDVWLMLQSNDCQCNKKSVVTFIEFLPLAFVHIFCDLFLEEGPSKMKYIFFYLLIYLENAAMLVVWYFLTIIEELWYRYPSCIAVIGGFVIGVIFQCLY